MNRNKKKKIKAEKRRKTRTEHINAEKVKHKRPKGKVRKKAPKIGRVGGREGDRLRLGTLRGQSPLST